MNLLLFNSTDYYRVCQKEIEMDVAKDKAVGVLIRRLRIERGLTLHEAAVQIYTSAALLLRKERGHQPLERGDLSLIISAYALESYIAQVLWHTAGLVPEPTAAPATVPTDMIQLLLKQMDLPTYVVNPFGYVVAWNQSADVLWQAVGASPGSRHALDLVFNRGIEPWVGEQWESVVMHTLHTFSLRIRPYTHQPAYNRLMTYLYKRFDSHFATWWEQVRTLSPSADPLMSVNTIRLRYDVGLPAIEYRMLETSLLASTDMVMVVCVPADAVHFARHAGLVSWMANLGLMEAN
jgi:transcriptional regulator with XRE-family HTH domain